MSDETLHITLTGRAPVTIVKADWPRIARAEDNDATQPGNQPNRTWTLTVRRHADGRAIVYGEYSTAWQGESDIDAGELLAPGDDIPAAVHRVAETIGRPDLAQYCLADLPPETL